MPEPLGKLEVKIQGDTAPLAKDLGEAKAMTEKARSEIAAIEAKWLAREYKERVAWEAKKQKESESSARKASDVAAREAKRAADAQEREAKRAAMAAEREAKRAALAREKEAARAAMAEARAMSRGTLAGLGGGTSARISDVGGRLPGSRKGFAQDVTSGSKEATFALMQLGNTLDDLQYVPQMGLRPILNNIMQFAPQIGIALLGFDMLRKGITAAFNALMSGGTLSQFATDVEKLTAKVEELEGAWLKSARAVKTLDQARQDLKAAEEAQKVKDMPSEAQEEGKRAFDEARKKVGGGGTESILRGLLGKRFSAKDVEESVQSGRITHEEAYGHGIEGKSAKEINQLMEGDRTLEADLRALTLGKMVNEWIADLARGDEQARKRLMAMIAADERLGARDAAGRLTNKFARALEEESPEALAAKKASGEIGEAMLEEIEGMIAAMDRMHKHNEASRQEDEEKRKEDEKRQREAEHRAADLGKPMQARLTEKALGGGVVDEETMRAELENQGLSAEDARAMAPLVFGNFAKELKETVRQKAAETGLSLEDAGKLVQADLRKKRLKEVMSERGAGFVGLAEESRNLQKLGMLAGGGLPGGKAEDKQLTAAEMNMKAAEMNARAAEMNARPKQVVAVAAP